MKMHELLNENTEPSNPETNSPKGPVKWTRENDIVAELKAAAQSIRAGDPSMTREKYQELVNQFKAVYPYEKLPPYANLNKIKATVYNDKKGIVGATIPAGTVVNLRLDIPSYTTPQNPMKTPEWIPTIHIGKTAVAHQHTAVVENPKMHMSAEEALRIATGEKNKNSFAVIRGNWVPMSPKQAREEAQAAMNDPEWIQVGMDPKRHTFFYDRKTQQPVLSGDKAIQVGGLVLLQNPVYDTTDAINPKTNKPKYQYEESIQEILNQVDKEILAEFERIPNGSMFRYGPKAVNQADACVDPTDMSCPGHQAGMKCELEHPNSPEYCHGNNLSFDNGVEQAKNMMARGFTANSPTIWGKGGFIKGATNTAQYRTNNKQAQQQQQR